MNELIGLTLFPFIHSFIHSYSRRSIIEPGDEYQALFQSNQLSLEYRTVIG